MSEAKVLDHIEDAPHIALNQDGSSITLENWNEPANRNWSYRNTVEVLPYTQKIARGDKAVHEFGSKPVDLTPVTVKYRNRDMPFEEYLVESHCDGFLALKGNDIVYENYRRMDPRDRHLCQSVSKTTVCAVIGDLIDSGVLDPEKTVEEYIPEAGSGFYGIRLQDVLDMNVALKFSEDFTNPQAEIFEHEMISGWAPQAGGRAQDMLAYLTTIEHDPEFHLDGVTHYLCPNTDLLGCIIERVTGQHFTELFQDRIFQKIGAEADAYFCTDAQGAAVCSGGMIIRLRDLARYAQLYANKGMTADGTRVIPERWIKECLDSNKGTQYYLGEGYRYHNQMTSDGAALGHLGVGGQMLYANTETGVVVVQFSTLSSPSNGDLDVGNALYDVGRAVSEFLT
jgi:CubicO group peptidase (beta-lactamase class C family)